MLLVDQSGSTRFGEPVTKAALAVEVAAVLALAAAYQNDRVGALLFADEVERVIPPRKGRRHALRVIRDLVAFEPAGRRTNLAASLSYASRLLRHRSIVVVLSDFIAEGWERPLRRLAARHEVVAITVDDPREHDAARRRLDRDARRRVGPAGAGRHRQPGRADPGERAGRASAARSGAGPSPRSGADQVHLETGVPYALPLRRAFAAARAPDPPRMMCRARLQTPAARRSHRGRHDLGRAHRRRAAGARRAAGRLGRRPIRSSGWARRGSPPRGDSADDRLSGRRLARRAAARVDVPGPAAARRRRADRLAAAAARSRCSVASVLPRVPPDSTLAPQPRADFVPRTSASLMPLLLLLGAGAPAAGAAALVVAAARARRVRGRCSPPPSPAERAARALGRRRRVPRGGGSVATARLRGARSPRACRRRTPALDTEDLLPRCRRRRRLAAGRAGRRAPRRSTRRGSARPRFRMRSALARWADELGAAAHAGGRVTFARPWLLLLLLGLVALVVAPAPRRRAGRALQRRLDSGRGQRAALVGGAAAGAPRR